MITIGNIKKIVSINSQDIKVMGWECEPDFYEFTFEHDNIHSTTFKVHMNRYPIRSDKNSFTMKLWDGISSTPLEYGFGLKNVNDPFALLSFLKEVIWHWNNATNK